MNTPYTHVPSGVIMSPLFVVEQSAPFLGSPQVLLAFLGNIGGTEILLILVLVLLVFGPKQLPEVAKTLGKTLKGVRKAADELRHEAGLDDAVRESRRLGDSLKRTVYSSMESPLEAPESPAPRLSPSPKANQGGSSAQENTPGQAPDDVSSLPPPSAAPQAGTSAAESVAPHSTDRPEET